MWAMALAAVAGVGALTFAVAGNDSNDGVPSGPVFTEHARLHVVDGNAPAAPSPAFTEHGSLHVVDEDVPAPARDVFTEHGQLHR
jgi:hypothetical protein